MSFKKSKKSTLVDTLVGALPQPKKSHKKRNLLVGLGSSAVVIALGSAMKRGDER